MNFKQAQQAIRRDGRGEQLQELMDSRQRHNQQHTDNETSLKAHSLDEHAARVAPQRARRTP